MKPSTLVGRLLGESNATAFKPERIEAFIAAFESGRRILVLTATKAELVTSREDVRQFYNEPHVAIRLTADLISANYGRDLKPTPQNTQPSATAPAEAPPA